MDRSRPAFVDAVVIELGLPGSALASGISTELASLHEAELVHIIDLAVIDKREGGAIVTGPHDLDGIGDLDGVIASLAGVLVDDDLPRFASFVRSGHVGLVVVWEHAWADPLLALLDADGGRLVAEGRLASFRSASVDDGS